MGKLRLEAERPKPAAVAVTAPPPSSVEKTVDEWRTVAQRATQSLGEAEEKLRALRDQLDELRSRERKARDRADSANTRANTTQAQLVAVMAERDGLKAQVATQEQLKRAIYDLVKDSQEGLERFLASF